MTATNAYRAKRALFNRLALLTATGQPLEDIQVAYAWPGRTVERVCIYGGGMRFAQEAAVAESPRLLAHEVVTLHVYIRIVAPGSSVEEAEQEVERYADALVANLAAAPTLATGLTWNDLAAGQADYSQTDTEVVVILALEATVESHLT